MITVTLPSISVVVCIASTEFSGWVGFLPLPSLNYRTFAKVVQDSVLSPFCRPFLASAAFSFIEVMGLRPRSHVRTFSTFRYLLRRLLTAVSFTSSLQNTASTVVPLFGRVIVRHEYSSHRVIRYTFLLARRIYMGPPV